MATRTFTTFTGAAFMRMQPQEISALEREEQVRLVVRIRAIIGAIASYMRVTEKITTVNAAIVLEGLADFEKLKPQDIAALSKEQLELLGLYFSMHSTMLAITVLCEYIYRRHRYFRREISFVFHRSN